MIDNFFASVSPKRTGQLKRARQFSILALIVALILTACSSPAAFRTDSGQDIVQWGVSGDPPGNWDPVVTGATSATHMMTPIYEPLLNLDEDGNPAPGLVESWEYNDEGTAVTFTLREGLTFQDRKSTRLNSSHVASSYAVFCLKKKNITRPPKHLITPKPHKSMTPLTQNRHK